MKIAFDCRYVRVGHHDGISRFSARLVEALAPLCEQSGHQLEMLINDYRQLDKLPLIPHRKISSPTSWREGIVALQVNRGDFDVVFSPMQTMGSWFRRYRLLLTVHDLIYYSHPKPPPEFSFLIRGLWRLYHKAWWPQRILLNSADAVVAVSESTKKLIRDRRLTRRPVYVVYNAADVFPGNPNMAVKVSSRTLVYMGSFMPYKNVETLVRAMNELDGYQLHLLSGISAVTKSRLAQLAPADRLVFHDGVDEREYQEILSQAHVAVSASLEEGFGIPVLEAMSTGTPVVISDIPIFHEIANESASFFDPRKPDEFVTAIRALEDADVWRQAAGAVAMRAKHFDWNISAQQLLRAMEETRRSH